MLTLRRNVLGAEHPHTLGTMHNSVFSYRANGEEAKAETSEKEIAAAKAKLPGK